MDFSIRPTLEITADTRTDGVIIPALCVHNCLRIKVIAQWTDEHGTRPCRLMVDTGVTRTVLSAKFCGADNFSTSTLTWLGSIHSKNIGINLVVGKQRSDDAMVSALSESPALDPSEMDGALGMDILVALGTQSIGFIFLGDDKCEIHLRKK